MQYYGAFYRTALYPLLQRINTYLVRWLRKKHKRLRPMKKAKAAWRRITSQDPRLFMGDHRASVFLINEVRAVEPSGSGVRS